MSPKQVNSSTKRQEPLKQGTLSFTTIKRVGSSNATSKPKSLKPRKPAAPKTVDSIEDDSDDRDIYLDDSEEEDEIEDASDVSEDYKKSILPETRTQADKHSTAKKSSQEQKPTASATANLSTIPLKASKIRSNDVSKTVSVNSPNEKPELNVNDRKWNRHYAAVKKRVGPLPLVHGGNQNKIHEILRVFDLSDEYGPCVGIPRVERWERAQALGLNPPKEVYDILNTKQGSTLDEYSQSVFYDEV